jgi:hypothetical protein
VQRLLSSYRERSPLNLWINLGLGLGAGVFIGDDCVRNNTTPQPAPSRLRSVCDSRLGLTERALCTAIILWEDSRSGVTRTAVPTLAAQVFIDTGSLSWWNMFVLLHGGN